jgi:hypothetical protein
VAGADVIDRYLAEVSRRMRGVRDRDRLLEELRGHLEDAADRHRTSGLPPEAAATRAIQACGGAAELLRAVEANDERRERIMTVTRYTGLAGLAAVPTALAGIVAWNWVFFTATLALGALAVVGLLAAHWRVARGLIVVGLVLFAAGQVIAALNPHGSAHPVYTVGIPAACLLAAVVLACLAMLRGQAVPASAVLVLLGGVGILLGLNTALYVAGGEPPYLASAGAVVAAVGWVWVNGALVARTGSELPAATA